MNTHLMADSRREFLRRTTLASAALAVGGGGMMGGHGAEAAGLPIAVFSKVYQELKLDFRQAAAVTADSGLEGVDCPVRAGGEITPERAADDLPAYAEALRQRGCRVLLLTSGIVGVSSPHAETVLRTAKKVGVNYYRLGIVYHEKDKPLPGQIAEVKARLKDLAALNKELGVCAVFQNHSPGGRAYLGGNLGELYEIVRDLSPDEIGVAFDLGHALIVHGDEWRRHFDRLKPHIRIIYVKDTKRGAGFVPFGEGEFGQSGFFKLVRDMGYRAPVSLHVEFDWSNKGKTKTSAALVAALTRSGKVLRGWLAEG